MLVARFCMQSKTDRRRHARARAMVAACSALPVRRPCGPGDPCEQLRLLLGLIIIAVGGARAADLVNQPSKLLGGSQGDLGMRRGGKIGWLAAALLGADGSHRPAQAERW